jgi:2-polyprenyl-6-methoxyphenol hydroxylase-like FAD-dependent oxidoreductase
MSEDPPLAAQERPLDCCIAGGGPAGIVLALVLARNGLNVTVLEKHKDFLRDFRGDTIHPSTLKALGEIGLFDGLMKLEHNKVYNIGATISGQEYSIADFSHLDSTYNFVAYMPQWDFLDFLVKEASRYPGFTLLREAEVIDLIYETNVVAGVRYTSGGRKHELRARLTVACDGRHSVLRSVAEMEPANDGAPMDVLWFRMPRRPSERLETGGYVNHAGILITLNRGEYWQCAWLIEKGRFDRMREGGLDLLRETIARVAPFLADRVDVLTDWDDLHLLSVAVDHLEKWWRPGVLFIGDAAHAMSPIGGVGINLAIQDAIAAGNILTPPLQHGEIDTHTLQKVQARRKWPARFTQRIQVLIQNRVIRPALESRSPMEAPWPIRLLNRFPLLQRLPAWLIGIGIRPERIQTFPPANQ